MKILATLLLLSTFALSQSAQKRWEDAAIYTVPIVGTVLDTEATQAGLKRGCIEGNALYGTHPSRTRMYAIGLPIAAVVDLLAYKLRHQSAGKIGAIGYGAARIAAGVYDLQDKCR
jgi:hypothetical protein